MFSVFKKVVKEDKSDTKAEPQKVGVGAVQPKGIGVKTITTTQPVKPNLEEKKPAQTPVQQVQQSVVQPQPTITKQNTPAISPAQTISVSSSAAVEEEVATNFSEGENETRSESGRR